jgi:hypothetical protein
LKIEFRSDITVLKVLFYILAPIDCAPCSNGILYTGRLVTSTRFPGSSFRVREIRYGCNVAIVTAELESEALCTMTMPAWEVALVDPDEPERTFNNPPLSAGFPALLLWASSSLKYKLLATIRVSTAKGIIPIIFCMYTEELAKAFGIPGPHDNGGCSPTYRTSSDNADKHVAALDRTLGESWDFFLDGRVVVHRISISICGGSYFRYLKASIRCTRGTFTKINYREMVKQHIVRNPADRLFALTADDED